MSRSSLFRSTAKAGSALVLIATLAVMIGVVGTALFLFPSLWLLAYVAAAGLIGLLVATAAAMIFSRSNK
ncbi:MAG: hypothetical protein ACT4N3_12115 [Sphingosinicella sp.]